MPQFSTYSTRACHFCARIPAAFGSTLARFSNIYHEGFSWAVRKGAWDRQRVRREELPRREIFRTDRRRGNHQISAENFFSRRYELKATKKTGGLKARESWSFLTADTILWILFSFSHEQAHHTLGRIIQQGALVETLSSKIMILLILGVCFCSFDEADTTNECT